MAAVAGALFAFLQGGGEIMVEADDAPPLLKNLSTTPMALVDALIGRGFRKERVERLANLEDVFIDMTGHDLREDD